MVGVGGAHWLPGGLINQPPFTIVPKEARMERTCLCQQEKSCSWNGAPAFAHHGCLGVRDTSWKKHH